MVQYFSQKNVEAFEKKLEVKSLLYQPFILPLRRDRYPYKTDISEKDWPDTAQAAGLL